MTQNRQKINFFVNFARKTIKGDKNSWKSIFPRRKTKNKSMKALAVMSILQALLLFTLLVSNNGEIAGEWGRDERRCINASGLGEFVIFQH